MLRIRAFLDPATHTGTARWVALGLIAYDVLRHGANWTNGALLLALAGVQLASRLLPPAEPPA